jgi:hypothetical protein
MKSLENDLAEVERLEKIAQEKEAVHKSSLD